LISIGVLFPLSENGFLISDDGDLLLIRLGGVIRAIRDLHFPVRMVDLNHGYGYPVLNFLYPLPFYFSAGLYFFLPIGLINTFKLSWLIFNVIAGVGSYLLVKKITKKETAAVVGAVLYLASPYRLIDIFYRASSGEVLAMSLLPFVFYFLIQYQDKKNKIYLALFSLTIFSLILSHNVIALLAVLLLLLYNLLILKNKRVWKYLIIGISLSAFFTVPALIERQYTHALEISLSDVNNRLVSFKNLFFNSVRKRHYSHAIEEVFYVNFAGIIISFIGLLRLRKEKFKNKLLFSLLGLVIIFLLISIFSLPVWKAADFLVPYLQFPWRLLSLSGLLILLSYAWVFKNKKQQLIILLLIFSFSIFSVYKGWQLVRFKQVSNAFYMTNQSSSTTKDEYTPIWVDKFPKQRPEEFIETKPTAPVKNLMRKTAQVSFQTDTKEKTQVTINKHYFPGWKLFVDGQDKDFEITEGKGVIQFNLEKGSHLVRLVFKETPLRIAADVISLATLIYLIKLILQPEADEAN
jgi:hypothetical protein